MYPEASYSFDGTATALPDSIGKCIKLLQVPVIMVCSYGAFLRNPLYNNLQVRKVKVSAKVEYLFSPEDIKNKSAQELKEILDEHFSFDHFRWQQEIGVVFGIKGAIIRECDRNVSFGGAHFRKRTICFSPATFSASAARRSCLC